MQYLLRLNTSNPQVVLEKKISRFKGVAGTKAHNSVVQIVSLHCFPKFFWHQVIVCIIPLYRVLHRLKFHSRWILQSILHLSTWYQKSQVVLEKKIWRFFDPAGTSESITLWKHKISQRYFEFGCLFDSSILGPLSTFNSQEWSSIMTMSLTAYCIWRVVSSFSNPNR